MDNFIDRKLIKKFIWTTIIVTVIFIFVPLVFYIYNFGAFSFSKDSGHWSDFGSFFGGIIGTLLNLVAAFFSLISIYITVTIAKWVQETEIRFNEANSKLETERFNKEIELTHKQNKPYPYLELSKFNNTTTISLYNYGTGPLIVSKMYVLYNGQKVYGNPFLAIRDLVNSTFPNVEIEYNSAQTYILSPGGERRLLDIHPTNSFDNIYLNEQLKIRNILKDCRVLIDYEDIFENKMNTSMSLIFFQN